VAHPLSVVADVDDVAAMHEPIDHRGSDDIVAEVFT
jgi:hypothetical protein